MRTARIETRRPTLGDERGFALLTVVVFSFLVVITGMAFFAMASYETKAAIYGEDTAEAFYLADAGIELVRSELLNEGTWRGPVPQTALGAGTFFANTVDSVYAVTGDSALYVYSEGHVRRATRAVEAWFKVEPPEQATAMVVMNEIEAKGNICITGHVHANVDADFGHNDVHLKCGGTYSEGFDIFPPVIYTEPEYYPNSTYYFVRGLYVAGSGGKHGTPSLTEARIFDRDGNDITASLGAPLDSRVSYSGGVFEYDFSGDEGGIPAVQYFFGDGSPIFRLDTAAGNTSVVVNFGEYLGPTATTADLLFQANPGTASVTATIINSRFTGTPSSDRLDYLNWAGGLLSLKTAVVFEPRNGIAAITHDIDQSTAQATIGTAAYPALLYVTRDVDDIQGQVSVTGTVVVLNDWESQGGPDITFNPGFIPSLPPYLEGFPFGGKSGVTELLDWREVAVGS